ncbi:MAG TPA: alpha/beta fold hydrolase [Blastocatellia bacterium]|nr:alpha/beta fold hydrolase [Blastocatellia bacterium]
MKKVDFILALALSFGLTASSFAAQKSIEGHWEGVMVRDGAELTVSFDFVNEAGGLKATFNSPTQRALGIPLRDVTYAAPRVQFRLVGDATTIIFDGALTNDAISGQFREGDARGTFSLRRAEPRPPASKQEEISFQNGGVTLSGTLLLPLKREACPAVVFLHGSGAEDRSGSRFLAEHFTRYGIAALIYDKRGVGKSAGDWKASDFSDLAGDAIAAARFLRQRKEIDPNQIGVYGHSQGGMLAPLVASRSKDVAFVISGAGSAVPLHEAEVNSITNQVRAKGISGSELAEASVFIKMFVNVLRTGQGWEQFDAATEKARATKWYPMLRVPPKDNWFWSYYRRIADYNAADYWGKVNVPVLLIYGERDIYVPVAQSITNIDRALNRAGNKDYTIIMLPRASHAFNIEPEAGQPFEWWRLASGFPELLTAWINQRMK